MAPRRPARPVASAPADPVTAAAVLASADVSFASEGKSRGVKLVPTNNADVASDASGKVSPSGKAAGCKGDGANKMCVAAENAAVTKGPNACESSTEPHRARPSCCRHPRNHTDGATAAPAAAPTAPTDDDDDDGAAAAPTGCNGRRPKRR